MKIQLMILPVMILTACGTRETTKSKSNPEAIEYNHLAVEQQQIGNVDSALYFIDKAISVDSTQYVYYVLRLTFLWNLNRNDEALLTAKKISKLRDNNNVSFEGIAYEKLGDIDKARELYKQTIDNWPTKELNNFNSRVEYSQLVTIIYGKEKGLEELNKIDESKLPHEQEEVLEYVRQLIKNYNGTGYWYFQFSNG
jgi:tetratricopeptide (TPR) repeat protein